MAVKVTIAAEDFIKNTEVFKRKGDISSILPEGADFGTMQAPPRYVRLTVTGVSRDAVVYFTQAWKIDFRHTLNTENAFGWQFIIEVDPACISASESGKMEIKDKMNLYIANAAIGKIWHGCAIVNFSQSSMTVNIPKTGTFQTAHNLSDIEYLKRLKDDFSDKFKSVLKLRRYYFSAADVDDVLINHGGATTLTKAQTLAKLKDKLDD